MHLRVRLHLLSAEEGGRANPIRTSYTPNWDNGDRQPNGHIDYRMGRIEQLDTEPLVPGAETGAEIVVDPPEAWARVRPGDRLGIYEGPRQIGFALVLSISD